MKKTIKALAFISATNRSPIMMIESGKIFSLERAMKEVIGDSLNTIIDSDNHEWRWRYGHQPFHTPLPANVIRTNDLSVATSLPHAKKVKITIEVED